MKGNFIIKSLKNNLDYRWKDRDLNLDSIATMHALKTLVEN